MDECLKLCTKSVLVESYYGIRNVSCEELLNMKYHHPFNLIYHNYTCGSLGSHICDTDNLYCNTTKSLIILLISVLFFTGSWILLCLIRHRHLIQDCKDSEISVKAGLNSIKLIKRNKQTINLPMLKYLLLVMFGVKLSRSCLLRNSFGGFSVNQGGTICTSIGNVTLPRIMHPLNLMYLYKTAEWDFTVNMDWGCIAGSCPSIEDCNKYDSYSVGLPKQLRDGHVWNKQTCKSYPDVCFLGRGCWFGYYVIKTYNYAEVYSVTSISNYHHKRIRLGSCKFEIYSAEERLIQDYSIVKVITTGALWLCPQHSINSHPNLNVLGDIQIFNGELDFPWEQISCNHNWYNNKCSVPKSFLSRIGRICESIPGLTTLGMIVEEDGHLLLKSEEPYDITVDCEDSVTILNNTECFNVKIEVWGMRKHSTGLYLASRAMSLQQGQTTRIKNPCDTGHIIIPCTGEVVFTKLSEDQFLKCENVSDKTMDGSQYFVTKYHTEAEMTIPNMISSISSSYLGAFSSILGSGVVWIIIILLLIRR